MTRILYVDVDGTLVGPGGNLFLDGDHRFHLEAAKALGRAREAGLEIVPLSGRTRSSMAELSRLVGAATFVAELGALRVYEQGQRVVFDQGAFPGDGPAVDALAPAAAALVARCPGRLEEHSPWNAHREASFMVRGEADADEVRGWLDDEGCEWADWVDNGVIPRHYDTLPGVETVRVFHLVPKGVSKRAAIAADRAERGLEAAECAVIGDALSDLECAAEVGRAFVVANALDKDPALGPAVEAVPNAEVTDRGYGLGFADVVSRLTSP